MKRLAYGLVTLSSALALSGCGSGPWSVPDKEFVTVPPKVTYHTVIKPGPTVTLPPKDLPQVCKDAVKLSTDLANSVGTLTKPAAQIDSAGNHLGPAAYTDDMAKLNKLTESITLAQGDIWRATNKILTLQKQAQDAMSECNKEVNGQ